MGSYKIKIKKFYTSYSKMEKAEHCYNPIKAKPAAKTINQILYLSVWPLVFTQDLLGSQEIGHLHFPGSAIHSTYNLSKRLRLSPFHTCCYSGGHPSAVAPQLPWDLHCNTGYMPPKTSPDPPSVTPALQCGALFSLSHSL